MTQHARAQVPLSAEGIDQPAAVGIFRDRVDSQIAPFQILLERDVPIAMHVACLHGVAVATVEVTTAAGVAGIYNVSTLAHWRNRGFASALLRHVLVEARERGIHCSALQAAPGAVSIYRRLGFEAIGEVTEYKPVSRGGVQPVS